MHDTVVSATGLSKSFDGSHWLFKDLQFQIGAGEMISLQGESGSGKSTLLNILAGIEPASGGSVRVVGVEMSGLPDRDAAALRARSIGFAFQAFHLMPELSVWKNVALPLLLNGRSWSQARAQVLPALARVGIGRHADAMPASLSGGEQQRVALLRALIHKPALVLADEPTGNLDPATARLALDVLRDSVRDSGAAMLMVTHSALAAGICDRHWQLNDRGLRQLAQPQDAEALAQR